jgi:endonuclease YncB( thermonuclease family)
MGYFKALLFLPLIVISVVIPALAKDPISTFDACSVIKVTDGDTITAVCSNTKIKVRLYGIDAPETEKRNKKTGKVTKLGQPYGKEAQEALEKKVKGQKIRLDIMASDRYKRMVSIVYVDGRNANCEIVAEGWVWAYRQFLDRPHASEYIVAEESARKKRLGLWQQSNPQPPWEFRKLTRTR